MRKLQLVLGIAIFVGAFLPWVSVNLGFGFNVAVAGTDDPAGILVLIMGLGCAGLAFLPNARLGRLGQLATGIIALIVVAIFLGAGANELSGSGVPISPGPGSIICIIAAAAAVITAIRRPAASSARVENPTATQATDIACPSCGALNPLVAKFCSTCGADLRRT